MILLEYSLKEKTILTQLINYLEPLVPREEFEKILDFYSYFDASYFDLENAAVYQEFINALKELASKNNIILPEELSLPE